MTCWFAHLRCIYVFGQSLSVLHKWNFWRHCPNEKRLVFFCEHWIWSMFLNRSKWQCRVWHFWWFLSIKYGSWNSDCIADSSTKHSFCFWCYSKNFTFICHAIIVDVLCSCAILFDCTLLFYMQAHKRFLKTIYWHHHHHLRHKQKAFIHQGEWELCINTLYSTPVTFTIHKQTTNIRTYTVNTYGRVRKSRIEDTCT